MERMDVWESIFGPSGVSTPFEGGLAGPEELTPQLDFPVDAPTNAPANAPPARRSPSVRGPTMQRGDASTNTRGVPGVLPPVVSGPGERQVRGAPRRGPQEGDTLPNGGVIQNGGVAYNTQEQENARASVRIPRGGRGRIHPDVTTDTRGVPQARPNRPRARSFLDSVGESASATGREFMRNSASNAGSYLDRAGLSPPSLPPLPPAHPVLRDFANDSARNASTYWDNAMTQASNLVRRRPIDEGITRPSAQGIPNTTSRPATPSTAPPPRETRSSGPRVQGLGAGQNQPLQGNAWPSSTLGTGRPVHTTRDGREYTVAPGNPRPRDRHPANQYEPMHDPDALVDEAGRAWDPNAPLRHYRDE